MDPGEPARVLQRGEPVTTSTLLPTGNGDRLTSRRSHRLESGREPMPAKPAASRPAVIFIATKQEWIGRSLESILAPLGMPGSWRNTPATPSNARRGYGPTPTTSDRFCRPATAPNPPAHYRRGRVIPP